MIHEISYMSKTLIWIARSTQKQAVIYSHYDQQIKPSGFGEARFVVVDTIRRQYAVPIYSKFNF